MISAAAYIKTLYELFDWAPENKYRFRGSIRQMNGDNSIEYDLCEPETIVKGEILYPDDWNSGFGADYYSYEYLHRCVMHDVSISTNDLYNIEPDINPTTPETLSTNISDILNTMQNPEADNGTEPAT